MPQPTLDILAALNGLGVAQGFFLGITFLVRRSGIAVANRLLGMLLLTMGLSVLEILLCYTDFIFYVPFMVNAVEPFDYTHGPLLYLYTLALIVPGFRLRRSHLIHAVVPLLYAVYMIPFYLQSNAYKLAAVVHDYQKPYAIRGAEMPILWLPGYFRGTAFVDGLDVGLKVFYLLLTFGAVYGYLRRRGEHLLTIQNPSLKWLLRMVGYYALLTGAGAGLSFTSAGDLHDIYIATALSAVFYGISFYTIVHSSTLSQPVEAEQRRKYEKSALPPENAEVLKSRLQQCMDNDHPYLDGELTMPQLAQRLRMTPHQLSQVINEGFGVNFSDYINQYRVEAVKQKLLNPAFAHFKIEEIAFEAGFNTKSTFQVAFRKFTGTTPSDYRKRSLSTVSKAK